VGRALVLGVAVLGLLAGCVITPGATAETLSGQVVDADMGDAIGGARVYLADVPGKNVVSSKDGDFTLEATREWQTVVLGKDVNSARVLVAEAASYEPLKVDVKLEGSTNLLLRMRRAAR
jgi:hypothetical protein